jgi:hypothetical protein
MWIVFACWPVKCSLDPRRLKLHLSHVGIGGNL